MIICLSTVHSALTTKINRALTWCTHSWVPNKPISAVTGPVFWALFTDKITKSGTRILDSRHTALVARCLSQSGTVMHRSH